MAVETHGAAEAAGFTDRFNVHDDSLLLIRNQDSVLKAKLFLLRMAGPGLI